MPPSRPPQVAAHERSRDGWPPAFRNSQLTAAFAGTAMPLGGGGWVSGRDATGLGRIVADIDTVPEGATNLVAGLAAVAATGRRTST